MIATSVSALALAGTIGGGAVYGYKYTSNVDSLNVQVVVVDSKANYALDQLIEKITIDLNALHEKAKRGQATPYDLQRIQDLTQELQRLRTLRYGK